MNELERRTIIQDTLNKKFHGKKKVESKVIVHYKVNLENSYKKIVSNLYSLFLSSIIPVLKETLCEDVSVRKIKEGFRTDDSKSDFINHLRKAFDKAKGEFYKKEDEFNLLGKIDKLGNLTRKLSVKEWKRVCSKTLGIDLMDDYFAGEFYREQLKVWTEQNANLIKTLPEDALGEMQSLIEEMYLQGKSNRDIVKEIQKRYKSSRSQAMFYAVDQIAKLNAQITQQQQLEVGVTEYKWSSSKDQRVRERHRELEGTIHKWSEPPVVDEKTGRKAHPGEDYRCRCVALPIFNLETLNTSVIK